jgi:peptidyl-prolyl cis-trans isomerase SurA
MSSLRCELEQQNRRRAASLNRRSALTVRLLVCAIAGAALLAVAAPAHAQQVVLLVNGAPVTSYDVDQMSRLLQVTTRKAPSRKDIIDKLIEDRLKLQEVRRWNVEASASEVDQAFAATGRRAGLDAQQFGQVLQSSGVNPETFKTRIKIDLSWGNLVRGRFPSTMQIGEGDIRGIVEKKGDGDKAAFEYVLRPIVFVVPRGSGAGRVAERRREAEALRMRFQNCETGLALARGLREIAVREPILRSSVDIPPALHDVLKQVEVGHLTPPEETAQGIEMFAVCSKRQTKGDSPTQRAAREEVMTERFDRASNRYLATLKRGAMIEYK